MKKQLNIMAITAILAWGSTSAMAETTLTFNNFLPPQHGQVVDVFLPWMEEVERATEGRVKIQMLPTTLAAPPRMFDLVQTGGADIAWGVPGYTTGRFTLAKMMDLPFLGDNAESLAVAYWKVYEEMFEQANEYDGVKVLTVYGTGPGTLYTTAEPPESIDYFPGQKFRVSNKTAQEVAQALGSAGVSAPSSETHEMLSRGVVDGVFFTHEAFESYKLGDVAKGQLTVPDGLYNSAVYIIMNQDKWNSLSEEDQKAIWSVSGEALARRGGQAWDKADASAIALMQEQGIVRQEAEGAFLEEIRARLKPIEDAWVEEAKTKDVNGRAALDRLRELASQDQ